MVDHNWIHPSIFCLSNTESQTFTLGNVESPVNLTSVFGLWKEAGEPRQNPSRHRKTCRLHTGTVGAGHCFGSVGELGVIHHLTRVQQPGSSLTRTFSPSPLSCLSSLLLRPVTDRSWQTGLGQTVDFNWFWKILYIYWIYSFQLVLVKIYSEYNLCLLHIKCTLLLPSSHQNRRRPLSHCSWNTSLWFLLPCFLPLNQQNFLLVSN